MPQVYPPPKVGDLLTKKYSDGNIMKFIDAIYQITEKYQRVPTEFIFTQLAQWFPELKNKERCPNCRGSMKTYVFRFDVLDALLLIAMVKVVGQKLDQGESFTEANKVHVQKMDHASYAIRSRTSQCRQLGLVAKVLNAKGKQIGGTWCITRRGWEALRGQEVPAEVRSFQNMIVERSTKVTTIQDALRSHKQAVQEQRMSGKVPKSDHTARIQEYEQIDWVHYGEVAQGNLLNIPDDDSL